MKRLALFFIFLTGAFYDAYSQSVEIKLGPNEIALNQYYTITVEIQNGRLRDYDGFPEIPGFEKRGVSSSSSMNIINGKVTSTQSAIQNYAPTREGTFNIPAFTMVINGEETRSSGGKVKVGPPKQQQKQYDPFSHDPFDDFFGDRRKQEFIEVDDDAFLALTTNKDEVYVGEGFTATLAFYVSDHNRARLSFYDMGTQVSEIIKEIRPENCWEENFNIERIDGERVMINNEMHTQYKLFQATFYPLNNEPVKFPSIDLKMVKYKEAKNPSFFSNNRKESFKTYSSSPKRIRVKSLPPHPLSEQVSVGKFTMKEDISSGELKTGESFNYEFTVIGEGNISSIREPSIKKGKNFDFYSPNIEQRIRRSGDRVRGAKSFNYYAIPNEPGEYDLSNVIQWVYFDPERVRYDTLASELTLNITGESKKNQFISSTDLGSFYDIIEMEDNSISSFDWDLLFKIITNIVLIAMLVITVVIIYKKK